VLALPAPEVWRSEAGLSMSGPRTFGYDVDYSNICVEAARGAR
jgi:DUF917 family protein